MEIDLQRPGRAPPLSEQDSRSSEAHVMHLNNIYKERDTAGPPPHSGRKAAGVTARYPGSYREAAQDQDAARPRCLRRAAQYAFIRSDCAFRASADIPRRLRVLDEPGAANIRLLHPLPLPGSDCNASIARFSLSLSAISICKTSLVIVETY